MRGKTPLEVELFERFERRLRQNWANLCRLNAPPCEFRFDLSRCRLKKWEVVDSEKSEKPVKWFSPRRSQSRRSTQSTSRVFAWLVNRPPRRVRRRVQPAYRAFCARANPHARSSGSVFDILPCDANEFISCEVKSRVGIKSPRYGSRGRGERGTPPGCPAVRPRGEDAVHPHFPADVRAVSRGHAGLQERQVRAKTKQPLLAFSVLKCSLPPSATSPR